MHSEQLAINGGPKGKTKPFPEWPIYDEREIAAVTQVLESRQWSRNAGAQVAQFEQEFAAYHNAQYALAVTNGTQAIELALAALGIGYGDEVIVPAYTYISTATAVLCANAVPILVDVDPDTYCISPEAIAAAITPRTRAILPVHIAGHPVDMDAIQEIAREHDLVVIEEAAHAHGAEWNGRRIGALDTGGIFSFQAIKLMSAGEGGIVLTNDGSFMDRCFLYGRCNRPKANPSERDSVLGSNCRLAELPAAMLRVQLTRLDEQIDRREANAPLLDGMLGEIPGMVPQGRDPRATRHPHYMYMFRYDASQFGGLPRRRFIEMLNAEGVPAYPAYPTIHDTPVFRNCSFGPRWRPDDPRLPDYRRVHCPVAEAIAAEVVWLHHRVLLGDAEDMVELAHVIWKIQMYAQAEYRHV